ncbi:DUF1360 domain-containing protein [Frankia sp. Cj3]|uniref:DUF1360 domain-containing protein n=1 Tax=Frankia sp. Cj3 TaxID=2880976 RepID=UPI001EF6DE9C|nr:DUF1360 domain-containing protein [Frankia sp. Cj3]
MTGYQALLALAAVARLTRLTTVDRMPVGWLRTRIVRAGSRPRRMRHEEIPGVGRVDHLPWWAEIWTCPWCVSIWIGAGYVALCWAYPAVTMWTSTVLAASLAAGIVAERTSP